MSGFTLYRSERFSATIGLWLALGVVVVAYEDVARVHVVVVYNYLIIRYCPGIFKPGYAENVP